MYYVELHNIIEIIIQFLNGLSLWHGEDKFTIKGIMMKSFCSIYYCLFVISLLIGSFTTDNRDESIFLIEMSIMTSVLLVKLCYMIWKKKEIFELLHRLGVHFIEDYPNFTEINEKINNLMKFVSIFFCSGLFCGLSAALIVPFIGSEKKLFYNIPLDWKNNEISFWIGFSFISIAVLLSAVAFLFSIITWYLLVNCAIKYEIIGCRVRNIGVPQLTNEEKENIFAEDLIEIIRSHQHIREYGHVTKCDKVKKILFFPRLTHQLESFLSYIFLMQIATSGLCICCSIYSLAFVI